MFGSHLFLDAIGTKGFYRSAHEQPCFIKRVAQRITSIAQHDQISGLRHESRHVSDIAMHDNINALHGNAAA